MIGVFVQGKPIAQGSFSPIAYRRRNGKLGVNVFQKPELIEWRDRIARTISQCLENGEYYAKETPVKLELEFRLLKPKTSKRKTPCCKGIDIDKAVRSVSDALTGVLYDDDCQICELIASKRYVESEDEQGVFINACSLKYQ